MNGSINFLFLFFHGKINLIAGENMLMTDKEGVVIWN